MKKSYFLVEIESEYEVSADTLEKSIYYSFHTSVESVKVEAVGKTLMITIPFKKSVLRIGVPYTKWLWGVSTRFDDEIVLYLGKAYISFWFSLPNKARTRLLLGVRKIQSLVSVRKSG